MLSKSLKPSKAQVSAESRKPAPKFGCTYCGSYVSLDNENSGICQFCEAFVSPRAQITANPNAEKLSEIQAMIDAKKIDDAKNSLDSMTAQTMDPTLLYGAANIYKFFSDFRYHDLDYARRGFMEENSKNVYSSLDMIAKSKEMFYKALRLMNDHKDVADLNLLYLSFMSYIKLKRFFEAGRVLGVINKGGTNLVQEYANMVYDVETKNKDAYQRIHGLVRKGNVNSVYYLAKYLTNEKMLTQARDLLVQFTSKTRMPRAVFLLNKIERLLEETKI